MKNILVLIITLVLSFNSYAFSDDEDRKDILDTRQEILTKLYKEQSSLKAKIKKAAGYATFSNVGVNVIFISAGGANSKKLNART